MELVVRLIARLLRIILKKYILLSKRDKEWYSVDMHRV